MRQIKSIDVIDPVEFYRVSDYKLTDLLGWVVRDAGKLRRSKELPLLDAYVESFAPMGVGVKPHDPQFSRVPKDWYLIHWPTFVNTVDTAFDLGRHSIVALLWHFREVLFRRSVVYYDLLRRKIAQHLTYRFFPLTEDEKAKRGYHDLTGVEEEVFAGLTEGVINTPKTLTALRESFNETLVPRGNASRLRGELYPRKETRASLLSTAGDVDPSTCTIFSFTALKRLDRQLPCARSIRRVRGTGFGPSTLGADFREIFYAFHFRRVDHGVARLGKRIVAINLARYIPYRAQFTTYYKNVVGPKVYGDIGKTATAVREYFEAVFAPLIVHGAALLHRDRVAALWGSTSADHILYLSSDGIARRLSQANRMETVRASKKQKSRFPSMSKVPRLFIMSSPPLPELGVDEMRFEVIRRPRRKFWSVPWEMPLWTRYDVSTAPGVQMDAPPEDLPRKATMKSGVTYVEAYDTYFYTYDMLLDLKDLPGNPLRKSRTLREWMRSIDAMPSKQFQLLQAGVRKELVVQQKRKPGYNLKGVTWTREEDDAICRYYRPGMTLDDEARMLRICRGRNVRAVLRRATALRKEMIAKGIYDLEKLPHRNYNAKLKKLVQDARDKAMAAIEQS
jgi:hypothetical protein